MLGFEVNINIINIEVNISHCKIDYFYLFQRPSNVKISIPDIIFGMPLKETGIKRYSVHPRQRVIQFAVTIFMKRFVPQYVVFLFINLYNFCDMGNGLAQWFTQWPP